MNQTDSKTASHFLNLLNVTLQTLDKNNNGEKKKIKKKRVGIKKKQKNTN